MRPTLTSKIKTLDLKFENKIESKIFIFFDPKIILQGIYHKYN